MQTPTKPILAIGCPLLFALCGAIGRLTFQMVETRYQILTFLLLALAFEAIVARRQASPAMWRVMANATAACGAIVAAKWYLEGVSPLLLGLVA